MASKQLSDQEIFEVARKIDSREARENYLLHVCDGDQEQQTRVLALLQAYEGASSFLESPASGVVMDPTVDQPAESRAGEQIGPYKLLQEIGEGGMGVVYMAEQSQPVKRRVALKLVKPGMDSRQVVARFEAERQALAMMDHPNIAKVLDCGTTESGRPYFVMELVKGVSVTKYCDENHLTPRERLELFVPICQAIQHAHQKGIIHRDIKPSNILIAEYDHKPVPKIIDFGVAKALNAQLTDMTMFTGLGQIIGTLEYMSPEQSRFNQMDVDTRSDIYSLGVLLYELLSGSTPFDKTRLRAAAMDEVLQIIREEDPPRPSMRLSTNDTLPSIAANRKIEPKKLSSLLRGELDWIVMKALEKDRARRYETATGFANDIQRYLNDESVAACPPSAAYKFQKFARKNKALLATTALVSAALVLGLIGTTWQAYRASKAEQESVDRLKEAESNRSAAEQAQQSSEKHLALAVQAVDEMYDRLAIRIQDEPYLLGWRQETLQTALQFYEQFSQLSSEDPAIAYRVARAFRRIGDIHRLQGNLIEARLAFEEAIRYVQRLPDSDQSPKEAELAQIRLLLAEVIAKEDDPESAEIAFAEAIASWEELRKAMPTNIDVVVKTATSLRISGNARYTWGKHQHAEADYVRAAEMLQDSLRSLGPSPDLLLELIAIQIGRASNFVALHQPDEQERIERETLQLAQELLASHPGKVEHQVALALIQSNLAATLLARNERREPVALLRASVEIYERMLAEHPTRAPLWQEAAQAMANLATALHETASTRDEAGAVMKRAGQLRRELANRFPSVMEYQRDYAKQLFYEGTDAWESDEQPRAVELLQQGIVLLQSLLEKYPDDPQTRTSLAGHLNNLGLFHRRLGELEAGEDCYRKSIEHYDWLIDRFPENPLYKFQSAMTRDGMATVFARQGKEEKVLPWRREAVRVLQTIPEETANQFVPSETRALLYANLTHALYAAQEYREAEFYGRNAINIVPGYYLARGLLGEILANCPDESLRNPSGALAVIQPLLDDDPKDPYVLGIAGIAHYRLEDFNQAKEFLTKAAAGSAGPSEIAWDVIVEFYLAATCHQLGETDEAKQILARALKRMETIPNLGPDLIEARNLASAIIT